MNHSSGSIRLAMITQVTHQVGVTGALAKGQSCSDSLPLGRAAETCPSPLTAMGGSWWAALVKVEHLRERQVSCFLRLSMGTPWQGVAMWQPRG